MMFPRACIKIWEVNEHSYILYLNGKVVTCEFKRIIGTQKHTLKKARHNRPLFRRIGILIPNFATKWLFCNSTSVSYFGKRSYCEFVCELVFAFFIAAKHERPLCRCHRFTSGFLHLQAILICMAFTPP